MRRRTAALLVAAVLGLLLGGCSGERADPSLATQVRPALPAGWSISELEEEEADAIADAAAGATGATTARVAQAFAPGDDLGSRVLDLSFREPQDPAAVADRLAAVAPTSGVAATIVEGQPAFVRPGSTDLLDAAALRATGTRVQVVFAGTEDQVRTVLAALVRADP